MAIQKIELHNYKSIASCDLTLNSLNIFIGANGAGKSNLLSFFDLVSFLNHSDRLRYHIAKTGGPDAYLRYGHKVSNSFSAALAVSGTSYRFTLEATKNDEFFFAEEKITDSAINGWYHQSNNKDSILSTENNAVPKQFTNEISQWRTFHLNDTGGTSPIIKKQLITDIQYLRNDGSNIASFLYMLKTRHPVNYRHIVKTVQRIAPFFSDFSFQQFDDFVELLWIEKNSDMPLKTHLLSDGILRFVCLITLLLQPKDLIPQTIFMDEPELGLHPLAMNILAGLIRSVSADRQLIISTQSPDFLNAFTAEDIIITDRIDGDTSFKHLNVEELKIWLEEYSLSDLWQMNFLSGGPR